MKVKFIHKQGSKLPDEVLALGNTPDTVWHTTVGKTYAVYAMCIWTREVPGYVPWTAVIHYLVVDDTRGPGWYPAPLFEVVDSHLPPGWHFAYWGREPGCQVQAIWGYDEIAVDNGQHYAGLIERDSGALAIFNNRRDEMDACLS
jgi:hypothetical protein